MYIFKDNLQEFKRQLQIVHIYIIIIIIILLIYISLSLKLYMRYIVSAESTSLFNYGIRTEKIFRPTQPWTFRGAGNQKNPDSDVGVGLG